MQARCGADAACVGYSMHIASEAFRPVSSIESVASSDTQWETHEKICGRNTEESWFIEPDAELWVGQDATLTPTRHLTYAEFARHGPRGPNNMRGPGGSFVIRNVHSGGRLFASSNGNARNGLGVLFGDFVHANLMWTTDDLVLDLCRLGFQRGTGEGSEGILELDASSAVSPAQCAADVRRSCPDANGATIGSGRCFCRTGMQRVNTRSTWLNAHTCSFWDREPFVVTR